MNLPSSVSANASLYHSSSIDDDVFSIMGTPSTIIDPLWYHDTGATHHINPDSSIFSKKNTYNGNDSLQLGNGPGMKISDVSSTLLSSPNSSKTFSLHNFYMFLP